MQDFQQHIAALRAELNAGLNKVAGGLRGYSDKQVAHLLGRLEELSNVTSSLAAYRSGGDSISWSRNGGVKLIEDIPGRRVPYVMVVDIPISADTTSTREGSVTISQEGPFVAVRRMATFQSALEFQVTEGTTVSRFSGRSFGRYRPIHSVCDINDSQHNAITDASRWYLAALTNPGALTAEVMPSGALGLPSNMSSFRSMEFDGRISVINAGSSYPRQNISIPSSFWAAEQNSPVALGALDFFERGEVLTVRVQPNHVNNPPAGNVDSDVIFPNRLAPAAGGWPFVEGQYDSHEGIATPSGSTLGQDAPDELRASVLATDAIARLPEGILTIAWEGYRIIQPVGPVG